MKEVSGIHQSDLIIRSAIVEGLADLRANPKLIAEIFEGLTKDALTKDEYGQLEQEQAKKWLISTEIPVFMNTRLDEAKLPAISIALQESAETEATLGDLHYIPSEVSYANWPVLAGPFSPLAYSPSSGLMKLPTLTGVYLAMGQVLIDSEGKEHEITEVLDDDLVSVAPNTIADFSRALLKTSKPNQNTQLESLCFRETYQIGCHAPSEGTYLTYLHSLVKYLLLRYKETLLEARGFERSVVTSSQFMRNESFGNEIVYSRFINITGFVRNSWSKHTTQMIEGTSGALNIGRNRGPGTNWVSDGAKTSGDESWLADADAILVGDLEE